MPATDRLKGSIPPLVMPCRSGQVDCEAYAAIVSFHAGNGSHGVLINGTTAEPATLAIEARNRLVNGAVEDGGGRLDHVLARTGLFRTVGGTKA